jgi:citrate lyase alpha subunit
VDVVVTEQGIAVNPKRKDLKEKLEAAGIRVTPIEGAAAESREHRGRTGADPLQG